MLQVDAEPAKEASMSGGIAGDRPGALLGALVRLDHPAHTIHWGWFLISVANLVVIALMLAIFILALVLPFPGRRRP
jgi:large-conductance mechanosensitive channel